MPVEITDRGTNALVLYHRLQGDVLQLAGKEPVPLLSVGNRHLVEHQLDWLADEGFRQIGLGLRDRSNRVEALVGDGARWSTQVNHLLDPIHLTLQERLRKHRAYARGGLLLVEGNALIRCEIPNHFERSSLLVKNGQILPIFYCEEADYERLIEECDAPDMEQVCAWAAQHLDVDRLEIGNSFFFQFHDLKEFLYLNREILAYAEQFHFRGEAVSEGIFRGRRSRVSERSLIEAPVFVGEECYIKGDTLIGPNVFIGAHSFIERGAQIRDTVIAPYTYIGRNTSFEGKYVCRNYVVDLENKTSIFIDDPMILGDLTRSTGMVEFMERLLAFVLLILLFPILMLLLPVHRLMRGRWLVTERILRQPVLRNLSSGYDYQFTIWQRFDFGLFMLDFIPSLGDIVTGKVKFVGNPPLTEPQVRAMDGMWRGDLLRGKAGLTGMVQQLDGETTSPDEIFATTIYYNATKTIKGDFLLFFKALIPGVHRRKRNVEHVIHHP